MKHTVNYMQVEGGHCFVCHILASVLYYKKSPKWLKKNHPETYKRVMSDELIKAEAKRSYRGLGGKSKYYPHRDDSEVVLDLSL